MKARIEDQDGKVYNFPSVEKALWWLANNGPPCYVVRTDTCYRVYQGTNVFNLFVVED